MVLTLDDLVIEDISRNGTYLVAPNYVNLSTKYKKATITEDDGTISEYDHVVIMQNWWDGEKYFLAFRLESSAERQKLAEAVSDMFPEWAVGVLYTAGTMVNYNGLLYAVIQTHTSQADWTPDVATSLFARGGAIVDPSSDEYPEWVQPTGAHDAYAKDAKVTHNEKRYISLIDANVWEPGTDNTLWMLVESDNTTVDTSVTVEDPEEDADEEVVDSGTTTTETTYPEWVQPTGASDAYSIGDIVMFNGSKYSSTINGNVWSPTAYPAGWSLITD